MMLVFARNAVELHYDTDPVARHHKHGVDIPYILFLFGRRIHIFCRSKVRFLAWARRGAR